MQDSQQGGELDVFFWQHFVRLDEIAESRQFRYVLVHCGVSV